MIKFLKKHKYTSLVAGALVIAVASGVCGGAFIYKIKIKENACGVVVLLEQSICLRGAIFPQELTGKIKSVTPKQRSQE